MLILSTKDIKCSLLPFSKDNSCIASLNLSNAAFTWSWVALLFDNIACASAKAALNSATATGTIFSSSLSVTLRASSTAISKCFLNTLASNSSNFSFAFSTSFANSLIWSITSSALALSSFISFSAFVIIASKLETNSSVPS